MSLRTIPLLLLALGGTSHAAALPACVKPALEGEHIGLLDAGKLKLTTGACSDCASAPASLWYFRDEVIAAPTSPQLVEGIGPSLDRRADIKQWAATPGAKTLAYPAVTWIGAPLVIDNARLDTAGTHLIPAGGPVLPFALVPKLASNRSFANAATMAHFGARPLRLRGAIEANKGESAFVARTIWPLDYAIDGARLSSQPLGSAVDLYQLVRDRTQAVDGRPTTRLLWERAPGAGGDLANKAAIGFVLNGAQGDDDESIGGHFAVATGRFGAHGEWSDWAVNNFYNLDAVSEKGILASTLPMDNYLMDVNSGQQYYRPSTMLVAVLNKDRAAIAYQGGVQRTLNHFYRHDLRYDGAVNNCAGLSIDVFRALGWQVPERGPTSRLKALAAYPWVAAKEGSLKKGRGIYDYLTEETTRLLPAVAFDALGLDLLRIVGAMPRTARALTPYEQQLREDVVAVILVKLPQIPSSRVEGASPAFSFDDYMARVPADHSKWQIVPVPPRAFPAALREGAAPTATAPSLVPLPIAALGITGVFGGALWRRRRTRKQVAKG